MTMYILLFGKAIILRVPNQHLLHLTLVRFAEP
jgi:hypothetical protein